MYLYKLAPRKVFLAILGLTWVCGGIVPLIWLTLHYDLPAFPLLSSKSYNLLYTRFYFKIVAFVSGITFAIIRFEYKYVDRLSDGTRPRHKLFFDRIKNNSCIKYSSYFFGFFLCFFISLILLNDTYCLKESHS